MQSVDMTGKRILAFGAHPDDIEFGCGAVLLDAAEKGSAMEKREPMATDPCEKRRP